MINKVNPLYILLTLIFIAIVAFYKTNNMEHIVDAMNVEVMGFEKEAREIKNLKDSWDDTKKSKKVLDSILSSSQLTKFQPSRAQIANNRERIEISNIDHKSADFVINKIVNSTLKIEHLEITRENEYNMSVIAEIEF